MNAASASPASTCRTSSPDTSVCNSPCQSGATGTAGCEGNNVPCITVVDGVVTSITNREIEVPAGDGPFVLTEADPNVPSGRVITEGSNITVTDNGPGGTIIIASTASGGGGGTTFQAIATNFATEITLGLSSATFVPFAIDGDTTLAPPFVLYSTPTECSFTYFQQETNTPNDCEIGFQIAATEDFASVLFEDYIALGEVLGVRTDEFDLTGVLTGGPPYYVRWGYKNPATLPTINVTNMSITFDGTGGGGGGGGTVTDVSVASANGFSGTVSNPTTTPEITIIAGDITPNTVVSAGNMTAPAFVGALFGNATTATSTNQVNFTTEAVDTTNFVVFANSLSGIGPPRTNAAFTFNAATGALAAGNLSGTNTGDQTITLTGDVTGSGTGSFAATIANDAVTYAKMQNVSAASRLLGRGDSGSGDVQEITVGSGLSMTGTTLSATAGGGGTVTDVSVVTANGVSGSVATSTTTPAITLTLGAITPTSVNGNTITTGTGTLTLSTFTLTVTGAASVSGTNTGDQTSVSGNAGTVTFVDAGGDTTCFVALGTAATGNLSPATDAGFTYNATTNAVTATAFIGALTGNADTASAVAVGGITGLGTGVATALAINIGTAGAPVVQNGALGTPSSGNGSNLTGLAKFITTGFTVDGGGSAISTGKVKGYGTVRQAGTITAWNIGVDTGTCTVKVWKVATGTAVPTIANVINTSGVSISSNTYIRSTTTSDFTTTAVAANDIFAFDITAVSGATELTFGLEITPT